MIKINDCNDNLNVEYKSISVSRSLSKLLGGFCCNGLRRSNPDNDDMEDGRSFHDTSKTKLSASTERKIVDNGSADSSTASPSSSDADYLSDTNLYHADDEHEDEVRCSKEDSDVALMSTAVKSDLGLQSRLGTKQTLTNVNDNIFDESLALSTDAHCPSMQVKRSAECEVPDDEDLSTCSVRISGFFWGNSMRQVINDPEATESVDGAMIPAVVASNNKENSKSIAAPVAEVSFEYIENRNSLPDLFWGNSLSEMIPSQ